MKRKNNNSKTRGRQGTAGQSNDASAVALIHAIQREARYSAKLLAACLRHGKPQVSRSRQPWTPPPTVLDKMLKIAVALRLLELENADLSNTFGKDLPDGEIILQSCIRQVDSPEAEISGHQLACRLLLELACHFCWASLGGQCADVPAPIVEQQDLLRSLAEFLFRHRSLGSQGESK